MSDLNPEDQEILKKMIEREKAVSWLWGWVKSFLYVAVPASTLYTFYELLRNGK